MFRKIDRKYWVFFVLVLVLWLVIPQCFVIYTPWFSGLFGPTGDLEGVFAPVNALFSGLAFAILIITIFQQQQSIETHRDMSYKQSFENNFFQLLSLHTNNIDNLKCRGEKCYGGDTSYAGKSVFRFMYYALRFFYLVCVGDKKPTNELIYEATEESIEKISAHLEAIKNSQSARKSKMPYYAYFNIVIKEMVSHYHRHIYHILKYIDESQLSFVDKMKYVRILRAQFNNYEFVLLFYSSLYHRENKFLRLIEKYEFFHNLDRSLLFSEDHQYEYAENAYGDKGYDGDLLVTDVYAKFDMSV